MLGTLLYYQPSLRYIVLYAGLFFLPCLTLAQTQTGTIEGTVADNAGKPAAFTSISLLNDKDSTLVKATVADETGKYRFEGINAGKYIVLITGLGFKNYVSAPVEVEKNGKGIVMPQALLEQDERMLKGATITGKKPLIQVRADRTVLNIAGNINAVGSTALELLRKAPGVRINNDEAIILNGKNGLLVYLDGKPTNLNGADLVNFLRAIPSSTIESIEIITNPSAKYDAAGNAGIIDIRTKKNTNLGLNGNLSLSTNFGSYNPKYDGALDLNYRQEKFNVYGNYNYFDGNYRTRFHFIKKQLDNNELITLDQEFINYFSNHGHNYKGGFDLFISPRNTIGLMINGNKADPRGFGDSRTAIEGDNTGPAKTLVSTNTQPQSNSRINYNLNYRYADTSGHELTVDADYGTFRVDGSSYQPNYYYDESGAVTDERTYNSNFRSNIKITSLKTDYHQRLFSGNLSGGAKYSNVESDNSLFFYNVVDNINKPDTGRTNQFLYKEKILAAYLMYQISLKKWEIQLGLRAEHTAAKGTLTTLVKSLVQAVDTSYLNFFPNAVVTYTINKDNRLGISYNRRIDRPNYRDLNPFEFVLDELTYFKGNPFLRPQYTDAVKLTHTFRDQLTASLSYSYNKDYKMSFIDTLDGRKSVETLINMYYKKLYNFTVFYQLPITRWWESDYNFDLYHESIKGAAGRNILNVDQNSFTFSSNHSFKLPADWSMALSGYYNSKALWGSFVVDPQWSVDAGIQKKVLKGAGVCKLGVTDIFNTLKLTNVRNFGGYYINSYRKWETTQLKLSFSYKFGNKNVTNPRKRKTGQEEEQKRAN